MLTDAESKLLAANTSEFPLLKAAAAALNSCTHCGHANVNIHSMLRVAIHKYRSDKRFKDFCSKLFPLPCSIAGVLIDRK